jgi:hypothetical protein
LEDHGNEAGDIGTLIAEAISMRQTKSKTTRTSESRKELNTTVLQLCHLLGLSCARYRKFKSLQAPELILRVETMLMKKYMSRLVQAESRCVN